jgi:putative acetyltransferase
MASMKVTVQPETLADHAAVEELNRRAFGQPKEAELIARIRGVDSRILSLVAVVERGIIGHIMFTPVVIESKKIATTATALGPMAVDPDSQRRGIGSTLVKEGLQACRQAGEKIVFVLGHHEYYPKFGFEAAAPRGLRYKSEDFDAHFFILELAKGASKGLSGMVRYHEEFDKF